jgi:hypothetical protein
MPAGQSRQSKTDRSVQARLSAFPSRGRPSPDRAGQLRKNPFLRRSLLAVRFVELEIATAFVA